MSCASNGKTGRDEKIEKEEKNEESHLLRFFLAK